MSKVAPGTIRTAYRCEAISLTDRLYVAWPVNSTDGATRSHRSPPTSSRSSPSWNGPSSFRYDAPISTNPGRTKNTRPPKRESPGLVVSRMEYSTGMPP